MMIGKLSDADELLCVWRESGKAHMLVAEVLVGKKLAGKEEGGIGDG